MGLASGSLSRHKENEKAKVGEVAGSGLSRETGSWTGLTGSLADPWAKLPIACDLLDRDKLAAQYSRMPC